MKTPSEALRALRDELAATPSPRRKLRLLADAWRTIRDLGPEDRRALAEDVGLHEAEAILDRLERSKTGRAASRFLDRLGLSFDDESVDLPGLLKSIRAGVPDTGEEGEDDSRGEIVAPAGAPPRDVPSPARPARDPVPPAPSPRPASRRQAPRPVPAARPAPPEAEKVEHAAPALDSPEPSARRRPPHPAVDRLGQPQPLISRFRALREILEGGVRLEDADLEPILDSFPEGWARRRALATLLRSGHPASLETALTLIEALDRPWHRRWCASDLLRSRDLGPEEDAMVRKRFLARGSTIADNDH